jgi:hypothetical protein
MLFFYNEVFWVQKYKWQNLDPHEQYTPSYCNRTSINDTKFIVYTIMCSRLFIDSMFLTDIHFTHIEERGDKQKTDLYLNKSEIKWWPKGRRSNPCRFKNVHSFISSRRVFGVHSASYTIGTASSLLVGKRPEREADHSPRTSAGIHFPIRRLGTLLS